MNEPVESGTYFEQHKVEIAVAVMAIVVLWVLW